jgi:hypothetical protein
VGGALFPRVAGLHPATTAAPHTAIAKIKFIIFIFFDFLMMN